jgi:hypothetical protein
MKVGDLVRLSPEGIGCNMTDFIGIILHVYQFDLYYEVLITNKILTIGEHWLEKIQ